MGLLLNEIAPSNIYIIKSASIQNKNSKIINSNSSQFSDHNEFTNFMQ